MPKTNFLTSPVLPDIDKQIEYVKRIRKDIIPCIKVLHTELDMVFAIEQSLLAARLLFGKGKPEPLSEFDIEIRCKEILNSFCIPFTYTRVAVLNAILFKDEKPFTAFEIHKMITEKRKVSLRAVALILTLFKTRGMLQESKVLHQNISQQKRGRPEIKFVFKLNN